MRVTKRAWRDGRYLGLRDVLGVIGNNPLWWRLIAFEGIAAAGSGIDLLELEHALQRGTRVEFTWNALVEFSEKLDQVIEGQLHASNNPGGDPVLTLKALDSSEWSLWAEDEAPVALAAATRFAGL